MSDSRQRVSRESHRSPAVSGAYRFRPRLRDPGKPRRGDRGISRRPDGRREQDGTGRSGAADEALAHRDIGSAMDRLGRFAQAETHYKKALKLSPKDPKIWNDAGYSYYLQGRWADAERALKTAARLAPDDERVRTNLGLTLAAPGRTEEAFRLLSQTNGEAIGHANLGYLLAATGQLDLARQQYETALALRPDLTVARRALARIDSNSPTRDPPARAACHRGPRAPRSTAHPIDPSVNQASRPDPRSRRRCHRASCLKREPPAWSAGRNRPRRLVRAEDQVCSRAPAALTRSVAPVGRDQSLVKPRPAIGDPVDLVPARHAHQVLPPRDRRVNVGLKNLF